MHPLLLKVANLAELSRVNKINNAAEKQIKEELHKDVESDFEAFSRQKYGVTVATFDGWRSYGRTVRKGESARKINGVNVFHITQTTDLSY